MRVVEKVSVRQDVFVEIMLEIDIRIIGQVPKLLRPNEFVMSDRKERMAAFRNFRVSTLAYLVRRLQAAIAATGQGYSCAGCVEKPFVGDIHSH